MAVCSGRGGITQLRSQSGAHTHKGLSCTCLVPPSLVVGHIPPIIAVLASSGPKNVGVCNDSPFPIRSKGFSAAGANGTKDQSRTAMQGPWQPHVLPGSAECRGVSIQRRSNSGIFDGRIAAGLGSKCPLYWHHLPMLRHLAEPPHAGVFVGGVGLEIGDHPCSH